MISHAAGDYQAVEYSLQLKMALGSVAFFYVISQVYVSQLYYLMKASWARVILNLQVIITFIFDIAVVNVKFSEIELIGCGLLLLANIYLFASEYYFPEQTAPSTGLKQSGSKTGIEQSQRSTRDTDRR